LDAICGAIKEGLEDRKTTKVADKEEATETVATVEATTVEAATEEKND
jgi:hypothetical protein